MDWTIAFGPGGGNDLMARKLVQIIQDQKLYPADIAVENREGGSGATGWGYLMSKAGDPYNISTTSGSFLTTPLQADPGWTYKDFTHVGLMATDDALLLVDGKSNHQDIRRLGQLRQGQGQGRRRRYRHGERRLHPARADREA